MRAAVRLMRALDVRPSAYAGAAILGLVAGARRVDLSTEQSARLDVVAALPYE